MDGVGHSLVAGKGLCQGVWGGEGQDMSAFRACMGMYIWDFCLRPFRRGVERRLCSGGYSSASK